MLFYGIMISDATAINMAVEKEPFQTVSSRVRSLFTGVEADCCNPFIHELSILPCAEMTHLVDPAWEEKVEHRTSSSMKSSFKAPACFKHDLALKLLIDTTCKGGAQTCNGWGMENGTKASSRAKAGHKIDRQRRAEIGQVKRGKTRARILAATFELYGRENGLFTRVEEICLAASVTRQTFYNHFGGMEDLREALTYEVTHDFLVAVTAAVQTLPDAAERAAAAIRFYLGKALTDRRWAWSMVNISATGIVFGMETYRQAEETVREGIEQGEFSITDSRLGRDLIMGSSLAAVFTQLRDAPGAHFNTEVTRGILVGLGVSPSRASEIVARPLPQI